MDSGMEQNDRELKTVGWIGLGVMGMPMCSHLQDAGYGVTVFNRSPGKADPLVKKGAIAVDSPKAVAERSEVVFMTLGDSKDVNEVVFGEHGVVKGLRQGAILVDCTSSEAGLAREIYDRCREIGCESIDAPVSGNDVGARLGTLSFMAGGSEATVSKLEPIFKCMGSVTYIGPAGSGQSCKLGNQMAGGAVFIGLVEGLVFAYKSGLDLSTYLSAVSPGAAGSVIMEHFGSRLLNRDFSPGGMVRYMIKDLATALRECDHMALGLPGTALLQQLLLSLKAHSQEEDGIQALLMTFERLNNLSLVNHKD